MLNEIIGTMINEMNESINDHDVGQPYFNKRDYTVFPLSKERFHELRIQNIDKFKENNIQDHCCMSFIDGGNNELLGAPNFSIQLNRIYFNIFNSKKRRIIQEKIPHRIEFFSATFAFLKNNKIEYHTKVFPIQKESISYLPDNSHLSFSSRDKNIPFGSMREDIQRVASISRRFAEWKYATMILENNILKEGDLLVSDGTLQTAFKNESKYLGKAQKIALKNNIIFSGLSKTSSISTTTGLSLLGSIMKLSKEWGIDFDRWYYHPLAEGLTSGHEVTIMILKLHKAAKHIFRYEILKNQIKSLTEYDLKYILSNLAEISSDITFPGYPYGLIDADDNARVRDSEIQYYKLTILSELSKKGLWKKFSNHIHSSDGHQILNSTKGGTLLF